MKKEDYEALQALTPSQFVGKMFAKRGYVATEETRKKLSAAGKGRVVSAESIRKQVESRKGYTHSEETRRKISESNKGHNPTAETRMKLSIAGKRRVHSAESRRKISESNKGKIVSEATRKKLSAAAKGKNIGKKISEEARLKLRECSATKKAVNTPIGQFDSLRSAAEALNVHGKTIRERIKRKIEGYSFV